VPAYESWLGAPVGYAVDFLPTTATTAENQWAPIDNPSWWCGKWADTNWKLSLSTPMLPNRNFTLEAGARGDYDSHWASFARSMVNAGCEDAIIRIGWEFNGTFMPWAAGGKESSYVAYWRRIVNTLRSVSGQQFKFDWAPLAGDTNANIEAAYPGDAYVDIIGLDFYDLSELIGSTGERRWNEQLTRPFGLNWHRDFAARHGKTMSFPEWGLMVRPKDSLGGGDNPYYIQKMWNWIHSNPVTYAAYFEVDASDGTHRLMTTQFPNASAEYRRLARGGTTTNTTTPAPSGSSSTTVRSTTSSSSSTSTTASGGTTTTVPDDGALPEGDLLPTGEIVPHGFGHLVGDGVSGLEDSFGFSMPTTGPVVDPRQTATTVANTVPTTTVKLPITTTTVKLPITTTTTLKVPVTTTTLKVPVTTTTLKLPVTTTTLKLPVTTTTLKPPTNTVTTVTNTVTTVTNTVTTVANIIRLP